MNYGTTTSTRIETGSPLPWAIPTGSPVPHNPTVNPQGGSPSTLQGAGDLTDKEMEELADQAFLHHLAYSDF